MSIARSTRLDHRARVALLGTLALLVALVATAFAIGGSGSSGTKNAGATDGKVVHGSAAFGKLPEVVPSAPTDAGVPYAAPPQLAAARQSNEALSSAGVTASGAGGAVTETVPSTTVASGTTSSGSPVATDASDTLGATKIVKNGELTVRVDKTQVQSVVGQLSTLATAQGGYVASSSTNTGGGEPSGEVVMRIPVSHFTDAINAAEKLGVKVLSLTTSADDVTGHYVDLAAREHALVQTRATYLTILGRATTIGATLAVQDRIQGVQEQIDQLTGQLKLLSSQASYSTLTVDVTPDALVVSTPHHRHGISEAWHRSWSRFGRGVDALVGAIGPLVLALLILAAVAAALTIGYRGVRKVTS